jgi:predicted ester cyclase
MRQAQSWALAVGLLLSLTLVMHVSTAAQDAASRATPAATPTACPASSPATVTTLATALVNALNQRDDARLATLLAPNYVHHWGAGPDTVGAQAYIDTLHAWHTVFPDLTYTAAQILAGQDVGAIALSLTGTQTRPFLGFPASDHPVTWTVLFAFRVQCGQIAETWAESDQLGRLQRQGALPVPAATPQP